MKNLKPWSRNKKEIPKVFGHSLAIRELDSGSDNSTEIEISNLGNPIMMLRDLGSLL
jgi:Ni,Fe-hydrogenase III small subunit